MADKEIRKAVHYKGTTYTKGMEDDFEAAIEGDDEVDLDALTEKGTISGFAGDAPDEQAAITPDAEEKAAILDAGGYEAAGVTPTGEELEPAPEEEEEVDVATVPKRGRKASKKAGKKRGRR